MSIALTATHNLKRRVESDFLKRAKSKAKGNKRRKEQRFFMIVLTAVILMLALATHLTYDKLIGKFPNLQLDGKGMGHNQAEISSFRLAGVSPGMTPSMVRKIHPSAQPRFSDNNETLMSFSVRDTAVTVWHLAQSHSQQAFRIRTQQSFDAAQEPAVLRAMARQFGRPTSDSCDTSRIRGTTSCRYSWRADGIDLQARTQKSPGGTLALTLQAEDVQIRTFRQR